jgi:predicted ArsR family transcriptional regulator
VKTARDDRDAAEVRDLGVEDVTAGTRERVAKAILENGRTTAADLAAQLELTPAAVRRHLDALLGEGLIEEAEPRGKAHRGRGRPAKVFVVTDAGRHHFVQAYDDLAASALRFLAETAGTHAVEQFAARRVAELEERYRRVVAEADPAERAAVLAEALSADGYAASVKPGMGGGEQVCQHHCPVAHVAEQFPQLCEAETQAFARLLGTHVQRLATIAHGDGVCTTYVPTGRTATGV